MGNREGHRLEKWKNKGVFIRVHGMGRGAGKRACGGGGKMFY